MSSNEGINAIQSVANTVQPRKVFSVLQPQHKLVLSLFRKQQKTRCRSLRGKASPAIEATGEGVNSITNEV